MTAASDNMKPLGSQSGLSGEEDPADWPARYGDYLYRQALMRVGRPEIAEELVQDAFVSALRAFDSFEGRSSVKTWLSSILRNKVIDYLRKRAHDDILIDEGEDSSDQDEYFNKLGIWNRLLRGWSRTPDSVLEQKRFLGVLEQCLEKLPEKIRHIFMLKVLDNMSSEEISKILDVSASNIYVLVFRARLRLRECLDANWYNAES